MPRTLNIDDALLGRHEELQRTKAFESGLLLAQVGGKTDTLLRFVPTPDQEDAVDKNQLDTEWTLAHAEQVARMLPGGVAVLGCYVFASNTKLAPLEAKLQPVLHALAKRLPVSVSEPQSVLLLLPSDAKKPSCRACGTATPKLTPLELKPTHAPPQLVCFGCDWQVDLTLSLQPPTAASSHAAQLVAQLDAYEAGMSKAVGLLGGSLLPSSGGSSSLTVAQLPGGAGSVEQPHAVSFLAPSPSAAISPQQSAAAVVRLVGTVHGRAFALGKAEVGAVLNDLKRDVAASLRARIPLLLEQLADDDDDDDDDEGGGGGGGAGAFGLDAARTHALPRRAHVVVGGGLSLCDFVGAHEDASDVSERLAALLAHDDDELAEEDLGPEAPALVDAAVATPRTLPDTAPATTKAKPAAAGGAAAAPAKAGGGGGPLDGGFGLMLPMLAAAAIVAVAVAFAMMDSGLAPEQATHAAAAGAGAAAEAADGMGMGEAAEAAD